MKTMIKIAALAAASACIIACNKMNEPKVEAEGQILESSITKGIADKESMNAPIAVCYVETNDVNPLNAGDYWLEDGYPFFDIVELFASNIHKDASGNPVLYLNDKLTPVLEGNGVNTYVRPLQENDIKVILTVLGDWQEMGVANMDTTQADQFAAILAYTVERYGLDGIGFDDEYADYPWFDSGAVNNTSYSRIITKLHELMPSDKLITVFDWGNTGTISSAAAAYIDYAYHGYFKQFRVASTSNIAGMTIPRWSPISLNLGVDNSDVDVEGQASDAKNAGYGAMMCFNLRPRSERDPLPVFQDMSDGAYGGQEVTCDNGNRTRDAGTVSGGFTITYDMATAE